MKEFRQKPLKGLEDLGDKKYSLNRLQQIDNGINAKLTGQLKAASSKGGITMSNIHKNNKTGFYKFTPEERIMIASKAGKVGGKISAESGNVIKAGKISAKSPKHPNNVLVKCEHCGLECKLPMNRRWHGDNCKHKN